MKINMSSTWRRLIVFLVCVIAVLQVIHMTLLSRLEARKNSNSRKGLGQTAWQVGNKNLIEEHLKQSRDTMYNHIHQSSVLDSSGEFRIINFLAQADLINPHRNKNSEDVTIVSHCTANHLHHIPSLISRWHGPVSVAIFALTPDIPFIIETIIALRQCYPVIQANTSFHLVYPLNSPRLEPLPAEGSHPDPCKSLLEKLRTVSVAGENYSHKVPYPNNLLRNVARRNSLTEFVLVLDVDMLPNNYLHESFVDFAHENRLFLESRKDDKTVYVIPAFEMKEVAQIPKDKTSLLQLIEMSEAQPFYVELCWKCQKHTDYEAWQREPMTNKLAIIFEVLWRDPWEPFFFSRNSAPYHDERFRQYGFNRISQVCELHIAGYKFSVLNNAFVIHKGLKKANSFHKDKDTDQEKNRILFRQFKTELKEKYPDSSRRCY